MNPYYKRKDNRSENSYQPTKRDFYFSNAYDDPNDAKFMSMKVKRDLEPFREYIQKSIDNLKSLGEISAECREVKPHRVLSLDGSLLRVRAIQSLRVRLPEGSYYCFRWDNEQYGYFDGFEALCYGRKEVLLRDGHTDIYNDFVVFEYDGVIKDGERLALYIEGNSFPKECAVSRLDFSNLDSYRIEIDGAELVDARVDGDSIIYRYNGQPEGSVRLFGRTECRAVIESCAKIGIKMLVDSDTDNLRIYDEEAGIVAVRDISQDEVLVKRSEIDFGYEVLTPSEVCGLISNTEGVGFKNGEIELPEGERFSDSRYLSLRGGRLYPSDSYPKDDAVVFKVVTTGQKGYRKYGNTVTLELIEDERASGDIYSNVSYFFRESVEEVKDERGVYRIKPGGKSESLSQIEIELQRGRLIPKRVSIVPNKRQLELQLKALEVIMNTPCRLHAPLLELMQEKRYAKWSNLNCSAVQIDRWYNLTDEGYEGCDGQREFVKKALATPDFAILEGPPGSGKTTTILEIIAQLIMSGKRVMLAASTNAAIDNILERLDRLPDEVRRRILAVRLGNEQAISDSVKDYTVFDIEDKSIQDEIVSRANLVCGTIIGILKHPRFELDKKKPAVPIYDCLIIDEASKTTFQEFLVPAVYSKRWILSGDLKQLTPYIDKDNIAASLTQINDFNADAQQVQTILMHLENDVYSRRANKDKRLRFVIRAKADVIRAVESVAKDYGKRRIAVLSDSARGECSVSFGEYLSGEGRAALVWGCDILFCDSEVYPKVSGILPRDLIPVLADGRDAVSYKASAYWSRDRIGHICVGNDRYACLDDLRGAVDRLIREKTWSSEIAWRLVRIQELFLLSDIEGDDGTVKKLLSEIEERIPSYCKDGVKKQISLLREIALPSIIHLLQKGISKEITYNFKVTTLNDGFDAEKLRQRHTLLEYQHRMHEDISHFSGEHIYGGSALRNGTVIDRSWSYDRYARRASWINVTGFGDCHSFNRKEIGRISDGIRDFLKFAQEHPKKNGEPWTVACLTYYRKQESELKSAIRDIVKAGRISSFYELREANVQIMIYSVDKFQGKEADIVFLSMVKSGRVGIGFMDSPNRLNVALTRAKYQMVIVGNKKYFAEQTRSKLLKKLTTEY